MTSHFALFSRRDLLSALTGATATSAAFAQGAAPPLLRTNGAQFVELSPGKTAPLMQIERLDGKMVGLNSFRGKVVLLNFWATWCPPCLKELPLLDQLQQIVGPQQLEVVAVSIDQSGRAVVTGFMKRLRLERLRPYLDPKGQLAGPAGQDVSAPFTLYGMPISYVIDRQSRIAGYITGAADWTSPDGLALLRYYISRS
jgi:thiol-disulfide isomerase/thioredoxin